MGRHNFLPGAGFGPAKPILTSVALAILVSIANASSVTAEVRDERVAGWRKAAAKTEALDPPAVPSKVLLSDSAWRLVTVPGRAAAEFETLESGAMEVRADSAVGFLLRPLAEDELVTRTLSWRWRVERAGAVTNLAERDRDDRPLALHVWFPEERDSSDFWSGLRQTATELLGFPSGKVLTYVWGGERERGAKFANPYLDGEGVIIILRPGTSDSAQWYRETIDIAADFEMAFGYPPPNPSYLAVSADSDDHGTQTRGRIADLRFEG